MGIGPELPPELAAQLGRSAQQVNHDDDHHDDDRSARIGPEAPAAASSVPHEGPVAPDTDSDDDFGPALPPDMMQARQQPLTSVQEDSGRLSVVAGRAMPHSSSARGSALGPSLPPSTSHSSRKETPLSNMYSEDSDDDYGPGPMPMAPGQAIDDNDGARQFREREQRLADKARREAEDKAKPKREEWMLVPPKELDLMKSLDPTKLKGRGFSQKATSDKPKSNQEGIDLWTETPQQRAQRLEDEALGKRKKAVQSRTGGGESVPETDEERRKRKRDERLKREVEEYNQSSRKDTLLDQHSKSKKAKKDRGEQEEPVAFWDRDRDMAVGGRLMDDGKRRDVIRNAKELGGRFGGGSFL
ncbi:hypothetical protein OIO90_001888 [Microbotryomycetes sp. JL221]|nr:hypothetical protein OIO90_001888 [Microbotryomycetes sp. JL221]